MASVDLPMQFVIPSDFAESREVQRRILAAVEGCRYDSDAIFAIRLALEEAMVNAIKHGNHCDRAKVVRVEAKVTPRQVEITVEDEGAGFQRTNVPDPTAQENLHRLNGRGILLMETYMNEVQWLRGGRCIRMVRRNSAEAGGNGQR